LSIQGKASLETAGLFLLWGAIAIGLTGGSRLYRDAAFFALRLLFIHESRMELVGC
jgi:hypothetical protein